MVNVLIQTLVPVSLGGLEILVILVRFLLIIYICIIINLLVKLVGLELLVILA